MRKGKGKACLGSRPPHWPTIYYTSSDCHDNLVAVPNCDAKSLDKHLGLERMALVPMHRKVSNARKPMKSEAALTPE